MQNFFRKLICKFSQCSNFVLRTSCSLQFRAPHKLMSLPRRISCRVFSVFACEEAILIKYLFFPSSYDKNLKTRVCLQIKYVSHGLISSEKYSSLVWLPLDCPKRLSFLNGGENVSTLTCYPYIKLTKTTWWMNVPWKLAFDKLRNTVG